VNACLLSQVGCFIAECTSSAAPSKHSRRQLDRVPSRILFGGRAMQIIDSTFACYPNDLATVTVCVLIVDYVVQAVPYDHGPCLPVPACRVYSNRSGPTRTHGWSL